MFDRILSLFGSKSPVKPLGESDVRHALGALLVRVAKADDVYLVQEIEQIDDILAHRYKLSPADAADLRHACEVLNDAMPPSDKIAGILHDAIGVEDREAVILALWEVVYADGIAVDAEDSLLREIQTYLGISPARSKELRLVVTEAS